MAMRNTKRHEDPISPFSRFLVFFAATFVLPRCRTPTDARSPADLNGRFVLLPLPCSTIRAFSLGYSPAEYALMLASVPVAIAPLILAIAGVQRAIG